MIAVTLLFTVTVNVLAKAPEAKKEKSKCCAAKTVQEIDEKNEVLKDGDIPLSQVPEKIIKIAKKSVKGIVLTEAEIEDGNYELEGSVGQKEYEIKISTKGKLISVEVESNDDADCLIEVDDETPTSGI